MNRLNCYNYFSVGAENRDGQTVQLYRFTNQYNDKVIVEIFKYDFNVYVIKFFLKKHRQSDNRYNNHYPLRFLKRKGAITGAKNVKMVLKTVLSISLDVLKKDPLASFGYMGAPKPSEEDARFNKENINSDGTIFETCRYRNYLLFAKNYLNPKDFEYIDSRTSSIMLLRNNKNKKALTNDVAHDYIKREIIPNL